jgi:arabinan endo-1,5-alpha-L-arabinosidase
MNSKKRFKQGILLLIFTVNVLIGCKINLVEEYINVKQLKTPINTERIELRSIDSLMFEWERAEPVTNAGTSYELLFDSLSGDFTNPLKVLLSNNGGADTYAVLLKSELNTIARLAGAKQGDEFELKWAVRTKAEGNSMLSTEQWRITFVTLFDDKPDLLADEKLYMGGESEAGQQFKMIEQASVVFYEIYTKIDADKPYYFYSELNGKQRAFSLNSDGVSFDETTNTSPARAKVSQTGLYRLRINFKTNTVGIEKIDDVSIRISMSEKEDKLEYIGKGVWELKNYNIQLEIASWGLEERYKIIFKIDGVKEEWGRLGTLGTRPNISSAGYRDMALTESGKWNGAQFKFPAELCDEGALPRFYTDIVVSMTAEKNYTHDFKNYYAAELKYTNPIFAQFSLPDPDVIRADDGYFYLYATEHSTTDPLMKNAPIMRSANLVNWERVGSIFTNQTHPYITDQNGAGIWAPSVSRVGDKYVIYYSQPGNNYKHAIGVASSNSPTGPFTNHGKLIDSNEQGVDISIDAYLYQENGRNYLFWGSFREISVIELTADGLKIKDGVVRKKVGGGQYEAAYVHKRDGYYYLIVSTGNYAKGGTYRLVVGRSHSVMGPYINKAGKDMVSVNHELILKGDVVFSSPGHCSRFITDDVGNDWVLYHAYPADKNYRCLMLDKVDWINGWPIVKSTFSVLKSYIAPVFNK